MQINPYLGFDGNCAEAFAFYARCLGGEITMMMRYGDAPAAERGPDALKDRVMHARLAAADTALMGSDAPPGRYAAPQGFHISLSFGDKTEGQRVFNDLAEGGKIQMPYQETFWALGFGMLTDRFGVPWMVNCERPMSAGA